MNRALRVVVLAIAAAAIAALLFSGPVVIDWANAARGDAALDVALTAVVLAGAPVGPPLSWLRDRFVRAFLKQFSPAESRVGLDRAVEYRRADGNVSDKEKDRPTRIRL